MRRQSFLPRRPKSLFSYSRPKLPEWTPAGVQPHQAYRPAAAILGGARLSFWNRRRPLSKFVLKRRLKDVAPGGQRLHVTLMVCPAFPEGYDVVYMIIKR